MLILTRWPDAPPMPDPRAVQQSPEASREPSTDVFLKRCGLLREELAPTPDSATAKCGEMYVDTVENDGDGMRVAEPMRRREDHTSQHDEVVIVAEPVL
jgi:hypothetical protein